MPPRLTDALLLTAGLGTRLRPLTTHRAKPSLPVAGESLAARIIRWLLAHQVTDLVLNLHYQPESITGELGDGTHLGARIRYSWEQPLVLGSAGGPALAAPILGADPFFIINGDTLTDVDLDAVAAAQRASGALVTLALVANDAPDRYGGVRLAADGRVAGFARRGVDSVGSYHFIGVQVATAEAFAAVPRGTAASSIGGVYDELLTARPGSLHGYVCDAGFWDIGTPTDYWRTSVALAKSDDLLHCGAFADVAASATIRRSILWDRVTVGARASLVDCIVTDGVRVPAGGDFRQVILSAGADGRLEVQPFATAPA